MGSDGSLRFVPRVVHGAADYLVGVLVIALPFLFDWEGSARVTFVVVGLAALAYSLITDYELGLVKLVSFPLHLGFDVVFVAFMFLSPSVLELPIGNWAPYLVGAAGLFLVVTTRLKPTA